MARTTPFPLGSLQSPELPVSLAGSLQISGQPPSAPCRRHGLCCPPDVPWLDERFTAQRPHPHRPPPPSHNPRDCVSPLAYRPLQAQRRAPLCKAARCLSFQSGAPLFSKAFNWPSSSPTPLPSLLPPPLPLFQCLCQVSSNSARLHPVSSFPPSLPHLYSGYGLLSAGPLQQTLTDSPLSPATPPSESPSPQAWKTLPQGQLHPTMPHLRAPHCPLR